MDYQVRQSAKSIAILLRGSVNKPFKLVKRRSKSESYEFFFLLLNCEPEQPTNNYKFRNSTTQLTSNYQITSYHLNLET